MGLNEFATNITLGCCLGMSSSFGSGYDIPLESQKYFESYNVPAAEYVSNIIDGEKNISNFVDIHSLEAMELISIINSMLDLSRDHPFIPNSSSKEKITLFITFEQFREYCENQQYAEAFDLEQKITLALEDKLSTNIKIGRVAFL